MSIVVNTKTYTRDAAASSNSQPYWGPQNTVSIVDKMLLERVPPKPTKLFSGVARWRVRSTRSLNLTGALTLTGLATIDTYGSVPVGAAPADANSLLSDHAAGLAQTWAQDLANKQILIV